MSERDKLREEVIDAWEEISEMVGPKSGYDQQEKEFFALLNVSSNDNLRKMLFIMRREIEKMKIIKATEKGILGGFIQAVKSIFKMGRK